MYDRWDEFAVSAQPNVAVSATFLPLLLTPPVGSPPDVHGYSAGHRSREVDHLGGCRWRWASGGALAKTIHCSLKGRLLTGFGTSLNFPVRLSLRSVGRLRTRPGRGFPRLPKRASACAFAVVMMTRPPTVLALLETITLTTRRLCSARGCRAFSSAVRCILIWSRTPTRAAF